MLTPLFDDHFFTTADGQRVHYRDYSAQGPVAGPPVLCLHGLTRNVLDFEDLAPRIAGLGRRVIVASQRGRGRSDWDPQPVRYNGFVYVADMLALLDQLGVERAVFVGTSMGGLMTLIAAAQAPQRLAGAVLNDIGPVIDPAGIARIRSYVGQGGAVGGWAEAAERVRAINGEAFPAETGAAFWEKLAWRTYRETPDGGLVLDYDPAIATGVQAQDGAPEPDLWPLFEALQPIPTLVVRGAISDILAAETVAEMGRRKPDLGSVEVPDVGHAPFMTEPAAWTALQAFLAR